MYRITKNSVKKKVSLNYDYDTKFPLLLNRSSDASLNLTLYIY